MQHRPLEESRDLSLLAGGHFLHFVAENLRIDSAPGFSKIPLRGKRMPPVSVQEDLAVSYHGEECIPDTDLCQWCALDNVGKTAFGQRPQPKSQVLGRYFGRKHEIPSRNRVSDDPREYAHRAQCQPVDLLLAWLGHFLYDNFAVDDAENPKILGMEARKQNRRFADGGDAFSGVPPERRRPLDQTETFLVDAESEFGEYFFLAGEMLIYGALRVLDRAGDSIHGQTMVAEVEQQVPGNVQDERLALDEFSLFAREPQHAVII